MCYDLLGNSAPLYRSDINYEPPIPTNPPDPERDYVPRTSLDDYPTSVKKKKRWRLILTIILIAALIAAEILLEWYF